MDSLDSLALKRTTGSSRRSIKRSKSATIIWVGDLEAAIRLVRTLGGGTTGETHIYDEGTVVVMFDVEGNEFCIVGPPADQ